MENLGKFEKEPNNEPESFTDSDIPGNNSELGDYLKRLQLQKKLDEAILTYKSSQKRTK